jgi:cholesterol transport system auxiliary component
MTDLVLSRRGILCAVASVSPLTGCSLLAPQSAPQLYRLTARTDNVQQTPAAPPPRVHRQLAIAVPEAPQSLDTDRIALTRSRTTLDYFAGSAWTDRAPVLLQGLLVEAFENSGRFVAVGRESIDFAPDYLLATDLRDFEAQYADPNEELPTVAVMMNVKLLKMQDRQIIDSMMAAEHALASRNNLDSVVEAFDIAVGKVLTQIIDWTLRVVVRVR